MVDVLEFGRGDLLEAFRQRSFVSRNFVSRKSASIKTDKNTTTKDGSSTFTTTKTTSVLAPSPSLRLELTELKEQSNHSMFNKANIHR